MDGGEGQTQFLARLLWRPSSPHHADYTDTGGFPDFYLHKGGGQQWNHTHCPQLISWPQKKSKASQWPWGTGQVDQHPWP